MSPQEPVPAVSVLIPCFNVTMFIDETMESLMVQTHGDFEVVLLDDGSSDGSLQKLKAWQDRDPRVRLISHGENKGIIAARNTLLHEARGEYLAWLDADDIARADRLEKQLAFLDTHSDYAAVTCEYIEFSAQEEIYRARQPQDVSAGALLFYNYVLNPGAMVRASVVAKHRIKFDGTLAGASDYQFWVDVSKVGAIGVIHEPLMRYRRHEKQESTAQIERQLRGCQQIALRQLKALGIKNVDESDMAQFLIYPADILSLPYSRRSMKKSCAIGQSLFALLPQGQYGNYAKSLVVHLLRRHAVRSGVSGLYYYIKTMGLRMFLKGKYCGLALFIDCVRKKY